MVLIRSRVVIVWAKSFVCPVTVEGDDNLQQIIVETISLDFITSLLLLLVRECPDEAKSSLRGLEYQLFGYYHHFVDHNGDSIHMCYGR